MRIAPGTRLYLTTVVSLAAVAFATLSGMEAGAASVDRAWWTLGAVLASVTAAGLPAYEQIRRERLRSQAEQAAVELRAASPAGLGHAVQTLRQLLPSEIFGSQVLRGYRWAIPCAEISDWPRFAWRGAHLDVARHYLPVEFLLRYIGLLALHKINVFHLHLTDDQGWRMEVRRYPLLTEVGSWRKQSPVGLAKEKRFDGTPHGGCYTVAFSLTGNPDGGPQIKRGFLRVTQHGMGHPAAQKGFAFDTAGKSRADMGYVPQRFRFRALGPAVTLTFGSTTPGAYGPGIDAVSVAPTHPMDCRFGHI